MSTPYVRVWYAVAVAFIACTVTAISSVWYTSVQQQRNDQRWCALLVSVGDAQRTRPPKTDSGKAFAAQIEKLRRDFHCPRAT